MADRIISRVTLRKSGGEADAPVKSSVPAFKVPVVAEIAVSRVTDENVAVGGTNTIVRTIEVNIPSSVLDEAAEASGIELPKPRPKKKGSS